ncbi:MAG: hypothetical protein ACRDV6_03085 [Acidimicrobiales bacterium]
MPVIYASTDVDSSDAERRAAIFEGDFFVYGPRPNTAALCDFSRDTIEQMLGFQPFWAQQRMSETEFATLFSGALRNFNRRRTALDLAAAVVRDLGCDPHTTYLSPPSLMAMAGQGFLAQGFGGLRHPHRDTWYAASPSQVHWWMSLYDVDELSSLAFHPRYWDLPVVNSSGDYIYGADQELEGAATPPALGAPRPLETIVLSPEIRIASAVGGLVMFSSAQLHSVVPNDTLKTYFAVHFQTVSEADLRRGVGAINLDGEARGSGLSSFLRCDDLSPFPDQLLGGQSERAREVNGP